MSFWNVNLDDWIRRQLYFDESISAYVFRTTDWYDNNSWHNKYSEFHDIIEWYNADRLEEKDLLEEFQDIIPRHNKQEWPEELVIEEYQTMPEEQINLEPFISYYYYKCRS